MTEISYAQLDRLLGDRDRNDTPCPLCTPYRRREHQHIKCLRIWRKDVDMLTYQCAHCEAHGFVFNDLDEQQRQRIESAGGRGVRDYMQEDRRDADLALDVHLRERRNAAAREQARELAQRIERARELWLASQPIEGTVAESWLRMRIGQLSRFLDRIPSTLRYLPRGVLRDGHALIGACGLPGEPEPGVLHIELHQVMAVQTIFLNDDGTQRLGRKTHGAPRGAPLVVAPMTDMLALAIGEGLVKVLTFALLQGMGGWASGGTSFLKHLVPTVPDYVDSVSLLEDNNQAGIMATGELRRGLEARFDATRAHGLEVIVVSQFKLGDEWPMTKTSETSTTSS